MLTNLYNVSVPGTVIGHQPPAQIQQPAQPPREEIRPAELSLERSLNFYADYSGCGHWRMIWPELILNSHSKMTVHGTTVMIFDDKFYHGLKSIRIQRQATPHQRKFIEWLKGLSQKLDFRLIYEIDDLVFSEDIPDYNKFKAAFTDPAIRESAQAIMSMCDEITVTCDFMKDYYKNKTNHQHITVIPNYMPKFWMGQYYDEKRLKINYDKNRKRPRVLYPGSGAHFDVDNRVKQQDDFGHVVQEVIKTRNKFKWVFLGAYPLSVTPYIKDGTMEYVPWKRLMEYPESVYDARCNVLVAPLQPNDFNRCKSDLKHIEACAFGLPSVCQDLCTYADAPNKFTTGAEMVDQIIEVTKSKDTYMKISRKGRKHAETRWLETDSNIDKYTELYTLPYGHPDRLLINKVNKI